MPESFPHTMEMGMSRIPPDDPAKRETAPKQESEPEKKEIAATPEKVEEFLDREAEILGAYGMKGDIALERGSNGWAFDFQNRRLIYDPNFFVERGYNLKETLFATTHELMAHYGELLRDSETVLKEAKRYSTREHLHLLYNVFEDVLGNRRIVSELPFLEETRETLYKEKMFPQTDYQENANHVQFAYGFIREAMVPGEAANLSPEARAALEGLRDFGKDHIDILDLVTTPTIEPKDRFQIMRKIVEPAYLELYKADVENEKKKGKKGGESKPGEGSGNPSQPPQESQGQGGKGQEKKRWPWQRKKSPGEGEGEKNKESAGKGGKLGGEKGKEHGGPSRQDIEKRFKKQYKTYEDTHPEPLSAKDEEKIKKTIEQITNERGGEASMDRKLLELWAREHGVNPDDVLGYRKEYQEIAPLVSQLREVFKTIISKRLKERLRFSPQLKREGEELDDSAIADAYIESRAGGDPYAFREVERAKREAEGYGALDMTLVNDLSGSMGEGAKLPMDRKSKMLFLESLTDFQREIEEAELESGLSLGLNVRTETRAFGEFGDAELKPLSPDLSEKDRIGIWKKMQSVNPNAGTPDYLSLEKIKEMLTPEYVEELKQKTRRKVVVVLSDGASHDQARYTRAAEDLKKHGIILIDLGMMTSARPDAEVVDDIKKLPEAVQKVILKYTQDL